MFGLVQMTEKKEESAADVGYGSSYSNLVAGAGYRFMKESEEIKIDDEWYNYFRTIWTPYYSVSMISYKNITLAFHVPHRRKLSTPTAPSGMAKWSCRHKRLPDAKHCDVCYALRGLKVTE